MNITGGASITSKGFDIAHTILKSVAAEGCYMWTEDGHQHIDWVMAKKIREVAA